MDMESAAKAAYDLDLDDLLPVSELVPFENYCKGDAFRHELECDRNFVEAEPVQSPPRRPLETPPTINTTTSASRRAKRRRHHRKRRDFRNQIWTKNRTTKSLRSSSMDGVGQHHHHHHHQTTIPRVNPIFLWVKQQDTKIMEVKCEDYDKRNRILLTKTASGWRAIPRIESMKTKPAVNNNNNNNNKARKKKNRKRKLKTIAVQVEEEMLLNGKTPNEEEEECNGSADGGDGAKDEDEEDDGYDDDNNNEGTRLEAAGEDRGGDEEEEEETAEGANGGEERNRDEEDGDGDDDDDEEDDDEDDEIDDVFEEDDDDEAYEEEDVEGNIPAFTISVGEEKDAGQRSEDVDEDEDDEEVEEEDVAAEAEEAQEEAAAAGKENECETEQTSCDMDEAADEPEEDIENPLHTLLAVAELELKKTSEEQERKCVVSLSDSEETETEPNYHPNIKEEEEEEEVEREEEDEDGTSQITERADQEQETSESEHEHEREQEERAAADDDDEEEDEEESGKEPHEMLEDLLKDIKREPVSEVIVLDDDDDDDDNPEGDLAMDCMKQDVYDEYCDYNDDEDNALVMDDILHTLEQSLANPDVCSTNQIITSTTKNNEDEAQDVKEKAVKEEEIAKQEQPAIKTEEVKETEEPQVQQVQKREQEEDEDGMDEVQDEREIECSTNEVMNEDANEVEDEAVDGCNEVAEQDQPTDLSCAKKCVDNPEPPRIRKQAIPIKITIPSPDTSGIPALTPEPAHSGSRRLSTNSHSPLLSGNQDMAISSTVPRPTNHPHPSTSITMGNVVASASAAAVSKEPCKSPREVTASKGPGGKPPGKPPPHPSPGHSLNASIAKLQNGLKKASPPVAVPLETDILEDLQKILEKPPLEQFEYLMNEMNRKIPDPLLVPKEALNAVMKQPVTEIPKLLDDERSNAMRYRLDDPDMLIISHVQMRIILQEQYEAELIRRVLATNNTIIRQREPLKKAQSITITSTTGSSGGGGSSVSPSSSCSSSSTVAKDEHAGAIRKRDRRKEAGTPNNNSLVPAPTIPSTNPFNILQSQWLLMPYLYQLEQAAKQASNTFNMHTKTPPPPPIAQPPPPFPYLMPLPLSPNQQKEQHQHQHQHQQILNLNLKEMEQKQLEQLIQYEKEREQKQRELEKKEREEREKQLKEQQKREHMLHQQREQMLQKQREQLLQEQIIQQQREQLLNHQKEQMMLQQQREQQLHHFLQQNQMMHRTHVPPPDVQHQSMQHPTKRPKYTVNNNNPLMPELNQSLGTLPFFNPAAPHPKVSSTSSPKKRGRKPAHESSAALVPKLVPPVELAGRFPGGFLPEVSPDIGPRPDMHPIHFSANPASLWNPLFASQNSMNNLPLNSNYASAWNWPNMHLGK